MKPSSLKFLSSDNLPGNDRDPEFCRHSRNGDSNDIETKYVIRTPSSSWFIEALSQLVACDPNFPSNTVNTVYFDTPDLSSYWQCRHGFNNRVKLRLRWYGDPGGIEHDGQIPCFLEVKIRDGRMRTKRRLRLEVPASHLSSNPLSSAKIMDLGELATSLVVGMARPLLPTLLIRYRRARFIDRQSNLRMSVDRNIVCSAQSGLLVPSRSLSMHSAIFETKGSTASLPVSIGPLRQYLAPSKSGKYVYFCRRIVGSPLTELVDE
jgi:hypothetical protein